MQREMLEYEWEGSNAGGEVIISGESSGQAAAEFLDHYHHGQLQQGTFLSHPPPLTLHPQPALYPLPPPPANAPPSLAGILSAPPYGLPAAPKMEELCFAGGAAEYNPARIGLNLGGRTYFASSSEDDFLGRLYRRCRAADRGGGIANPPRCQAEGCSADLMQAKHYHRRHKVCEFHSKAATVVAAGRTQRFCQQCSRFHLLSEFDHGKRSCRKRLADHNRRRRKTQPQPQPQPQPHAHANHSGSSSPCGASPSLSVTRVLASSPTPRSEQHHLLKGFGL